MAKENEVPANALEMPVAEETTNVVEVSENTNEQIIKRLLKSENCVKITKLFVKSVTINDKDDYIGVNLALTQKIRGFIPVTTEDGMPTGEYKEGLTNVVYSTNFGLSGVFKANEDLAFMANAAANKPIVLVPILAGSEIDIIQQFVPKGEEYTNPFSTKERAIPVIFDHNVIVNHVIAVRLGIVGKKMVDKVLDKYVDVMVM